MNLNAFFNSLQKIPVERVGSNRREERCEHGKDMLGSPSKNRKTESGCTGGVEQIRSTVINMCDQIQELRCRLDKVAGNAGDLKLQMTDKKVSEEMICY